jgi:predicted acetyltransferase
VAEHSSRRAVTVGLAGDERDRRALERLYLHDLSAYTDHYVPDDEGRWEPSYLADWLGRPECHSLLARVDGRAAGFALVAERPFPHMAADADLRMTEFFVANRFRRRGVGRALAEAAFARFQASTAAGR